jgi:CsoR family transcriptional regulator, copper-sensing transcriptional repressor
MAKVPHTTHEKELISLRRIEGQVRGVQKMIDEKKYCVDIIIQLHAVINALYRVAEKIFARHLEHCVTDAFHGRSDREKREKIDEIMDVVKRLHKL